MTNTLKYVNLYITTNKHPAIRIKQNTQWVNGNIDNRSDQTVAKGNLIDIVVKENSMRNNKFFAIVDAETGEILYDTNAWNGTLSHMLDLLEKSG